MFRVTGGFSWVELHLILYIQDAVPLVILTTYTSSRRQPDDSVICEIEMRAVIPSISHICNHWTTSRAQSYGREYLGIRYLSCPYGVCHALTQCLKAQCMVLRYSRGESMES